MYIKEQKNMNKTEFEDIERHIKDTETSDECDESLERLYSDIRGMYRFLRKCRDEHNRKSII